MGKKMKKNVSIIALLLVLATASLAVSVAPVKATHTMTVNVSPKVYNGGPELKNFTITNNATSKDAIGKVVITFPSVQAGETHDYKPRNYTFPNFWAATYEPGLKQVTFEVAVGTYATNGIKPGTSAYFTIYFEDGPYMEGIYTWVVSTTDAVSNANTDYPTQTIAAVPEFSPLIILPIFIVATLLAVVLFSARFRRDGARSQR